MPRVPRFTDEEPKLADGRLLCPGFQSGGGPEPDALPQDQRPGQRSEGPAPGGREQASGRAGLLPLHELGGGEAPRRRENDLSEGNKAG